MAETLFRAWWSRVRRSLAPKPCPYAHAWVLDLPFRAWRAGPSRILGDFGLRPGDRVLEIGPGTGYYTAEAVRRVGQDGRLVCLDIQIDMLKELKRRLRKATVSLAGLIQGDACRLPLRSNWFDHVFLVTVLGELPNRAFSSLTRWFVWGRCQFLEVLKARRKGATRAGHNCWPVTGKAASATTTTAADLNAQVIRPAAQPLLVGMRAM